MRHPADAPNPQTLKLAPAVGAVVWASWAALLAEVEAAHGDRDVLGRLRRGISRRLASDEHAGAEWDALAHLTLDLAEAGWTFDAADSEVCATPPPAPRAGPEAKERARAALALERDRQLAEPTVGRFLDSMELRRLWGGAWVSVRSLTRDGRALASALRALGQQPEDARLAGLAELIQPYIQVVEARGVCAHTGLGLGDIWRYFRYTWASPARSVPGRSLQLLIRDAAAPGHPVIGIAALTSAAAQIRARDLWIGWDPKELVQRLRREPEPALAAWLLPELQRALAELYLTDLLEDGVLHPEELREPTAETLARLTAAALEARAAHRRFARASDHETPALSAPEDWEQRARSPLFRSKRAALLAQLLKARAALLPHLGPRPDARGLAAALAEEEGRAAVGFVIRRAKAERMGVGLVDIGVCGAIAPYNELICGKLVALLMTSPEVQALYSARYGGQPSLIASSMAGRPVIRPTQLAALTTSSLYSSCTAQYSRLRVPLAALGAGPSGELRFEELGTTAGWGSSQLSDRTVEALGLLTSQGMQGARVNSIFGEGVSPRFRKAREGLERLGVDAAALLVHGYPRRVYGVALVARPRDQLLGIGVAQPPLLPQGDPVCTSSLLVAWWRQRWLAPRALSEEVLARVARHHHDHPVEHGARVRRPARAEEGQLGLF